MAEITVGSYKYHIFTNTGTSTIIFPTGRTFEYIIIAGGGGGGDDTGGGGGAGEVVSGSVTVTTETTYTCTVGAGGVGGYGGSGGTKGVNSSISNITNATANGGGGGAGSYATGSSGGSGGGAAGSGSFRTGYESNKTVGLGNKGGNSLTDAGVGGGGGGSGGPGQNSQPKISNSASGGVGGEGTSNFSMWINAIAPTFDENWRAKTIFGGIGYIASGGSGGSWATNSISAPTGGGGNGGNYISGSDVTISEAGTPNTGGGGGGGGSVYEGADGGSGLIVIRYYLDKGNMNALSLYLSGSLNNVSVVNPSYNVPAATSTLSSSSVSLYATNVIASGVGFALNSDERIKKNIQYLNSNDSFELIKALKPATFQYMDFLKGTIPKYGYLAQEVESVLPYIVNKNTGYIPNFFETVRIEKNNNKIILQEKTTETLAIGTKLQFYDISDMVLFRQVTEIIDEKTFIVNERFLSESDSETFFLYGQEVEDYRSIDTDQMNTVLLSALQETQKKIDKQQKRIDALRELVENK